MCEKWRHVPRDPKIEIVELPAREEIVIIKKSHKLTQLLKQQAILYGVDILDEEELRERSFYEIQNL